MKHAHVGMCTGFGVVGCTAEGWERKAAACGEATLGAPPSAVWQADAAAVALIRHCVTWRSLLQRPWLCMDWSNTRAMDAVNVCCRVVLSAAFKRQAVTGMSFSQVFYDLQCMYHTSWVLGVRK